MYDLDFSPLKNQAQNDSNVRTLCHTEPNAKYLKIRYFKYIMHCCNIYDLDFSPLKIRLKMTVM